MDEWVWSNGGMILTGRNWNARRKTSPGATLSTTHSTRTGLGLNRASSVSVRPLTAQAMATPVRVSRRCPNVTPHAQLLICKAAWRFNYGFWWYKETDAKHSSTPVRLSVSLASTHSLLYGRHGSHCRKTSAWRFYKTVWQVFSNSFVTLLAAKSNIK